MNHGIKRIAFIASAIIIFTAGVMWGIHMTQPEENANIAEESSERGKGASASTHPGSSNERANKRHSPETKQTLPGNAAQQQIIRNLRDAMLLPKETRIKPLLKALEETTKLPLSKDLLDNMRTIVDVGEVESCHFLLSLMEQREGKSSVDLLLHAASHQNPDVSDRALFALEAVAGTVFKSREEAETWAATWKPDPERAELFAPIEQKEEEPLTETDPRIPGPRSLPPKGTEQKPE